MGFPGCWRIAAVERVEYDAKRPKEEQTPKGAPLKIAISGGERLFARLGDLPQLTVSPWIRLTSECHPDRANCSLPPRKPIFRGALNQIKSKTRARIEHVFGYITNSLWEIKTEVIGKERNAVILGLENLAYNMVRYCILTRRAA